ncbi:MULTISPECIES: type IA DNA topoisomerase [unclassified Psychrobacillus]|uniref:type IA DNA topoisomerase n=1 Tax=unclassified Psychrobacillus TaxID=2636677 RepID=UPI0030F9DE5E
MKLLIFEKPKQAKSICEAFQYEKKKGYLYLKPQQPHFPDGAFAIWCVGHIMEQCLPEEINPEWKQWKYEDLPLALDSVIPLKVVKERKTEYANIKKFVHDPKVKEIYHLGDAEQEGQLIVDEVLYHMKNKKPVKRVWLNSYEKSAVMKAFQHIRPNEEYHPYYVAALSRSISDYLIGINSSRAISLLLADKAKSLYSAGRCQSPILRILVERDRAISNFKPTPYYELTGVFEKQGVLIQAKFDSSEDPLDDKEQADALADYLKGKEAIVESVEEKMEQVPPPPFFNLTSLINEMNKITKQSPEQIQSVAQSLYENGYISYPRALPTVVNPEEALAFPEILDSLSNLGWGENHLPAPIQDISSDKRYINSQKTDDHYAIIPTTKVPDRNQLSNEEQLMYQMIANRLITAHYPAAVYSVMKATILVDDEYPFTLKEKRLVTKGWKSCVSETESNNEEMKDIPELIEEETLVLNNVIREDKVTTSPKRFTQGQLPTIMENISAYLSEEEKKGLGKTELSLGTVATRSNIIQQLMNRRYIEARKNNIFVLAKGFILIDALGKGSWLSSPRETGLMEQYLEQVKAGKKNAAPFLERSKQLVSELIRDLQLNAPNWQLESSHLEEVIKEQEQLQKQREKKYGTKEVIGKCLLCDGDVQDQGNFYGCSNHKQTECSFAINKKISGQPISKVIAQQILMQGKTDKLSNFVSKKTGKPFKAQLVWDREKKTLLFNFA